MENKSKEIKRKKFDWLLSQPIETHIRRICCHLFRRKMSGHAANGNCFRGNFNRPEN